MNKRWVYDEEENKYKLYFTQFYDEELIAELVIDDENYGSYWHLKGRTEKWVWCNTIEEAKNFVEKDYIEMIENEIYYLQDKLEKFKGE